MRFFGLIEGLSTLIGPSRIFFMIKAFFTKLLLHILLNKTVLLSEIIAQLLNVCEQFFIPVGFLFLSRGRPLILLCTSLIRLAHAYFPAPLLLSAGLVSNLLWSTLRFWLVKVMSTFPKFFGLNSTLRVFYVFSLVTVQSVKPIGFGKIIRRRSR